MVLLAICCWTAACIDVQHTQTHFTPHKTEYRRLTRLTPRAVRAQEGDLEQLVAAGGYTVGKMTSRGGVLASVDAVDETTVEDAAAHGATHVILQGLALVPVKLTDDLATTTCSEGTCQTRFSDGFTGNAKIAAYVLIRVRPENWASLPQELRPTPTRSVRAAFRKRLLARRNRSASAMVAGSVGPSSLRTPLSTIAIAHKANASLVVVFAEDGFGSGFAIGKRDWVVTNFHVVAGSSRIVVQSPDGRRCRATAVRGYDRGNDLAILDVPTLSLPALPIDTHVPPVGTSVVVAGHPEGLTASVSEGIVSAVRSLDTGVVLSTRVPGRVIVQYQSSEAGDIERDNY